MALLSCTGCKTTGGQASVNTPIQAPANSQQEQSHALPLCTDWPNNHMGCYISQDMATKLIEQGKHDMPNMYGITPLMIAIDMNTVKTLIGAGADVNAKAINGNSVLMHAIILTRLMENDDGRVQLLLDAGAQVDNISVKEAIPFHPANSVGYAGYTPLMLALTLGQIKALVEKGADVNAKTKLLQITPLILALGNNEKEIARYLIEQGADVNAQTVDGMTPLSVAPDEETVQLLLAKGANVHAVPENGLLFTNVNAGKMRVLLKAGFDIHTKYFNSNPLIMANDVETAKILIDAGDDVNAASNELMRPFGMIYIGEAFANNGVFPPGTTPLLHAIQIDNYDLAKLLIEAGANIDPSQPGLNDLLLIASPKMTNLFIEKGVDIKAFVNAKDYNESHSA